MATKYENRRIWAYTAAEAKLSELQRTEATVTQTRKIYRDASKLIQERVQRLYNELAEKDAETGAYHFKNLNAPETTRSARELRQKIEAAGLTKYVPGNLQRRLSVYEAMELDNWYTMTKAGQDAHSTLKNALNDAIKDQGEIWQRAMRAGGAAFVGFDRNQVGYMLGEPWYGGNFSTRLWEHGQADWQKVREELAKAIASGQDPATTRRKLVEILGPAYRGTGPKGINYAAERIVRTEMARAATTADLIKWKNEGVDEVQWNARLEANTCANCADRDGRVYKINGPMDTVPLHPNCRCFLTPYDRIAEAARGDQQRERQYKTADGDYEMINWAPMTEYTKAGKGWTLGSAALRVSDYFFRSSPWTQYEPARTGVHFQGDITYAPDGAIDQNSQAIINLTENTLQAAIDKYPEIMDELNRAANGTIYLHRGSGVYLDGTLHRVGGAVKQKIAQRSGYIAITYPTKYGMDYTQMLETMAKEAAKNHELGKWSTGTVNHTIVHELGHVLENNITWRKGDIKNILKKATNKNSLKAALEEVSKLSSYGAKNEHEAFAELFALAQDQDATRYSLTAARFVQALDATRAKLPKTRPKMTIKVD